MDVEKRPSDDDEATSAALSSSPTWTLPLEVRYLRQYALENNDWHEFQVRQRESRYACRSPRRYVSNVNRTRGMCTQIV